MSTRTVIPPLQVQGSPTKQSYEVLQGRLLAAEDDTRQLMEQLGSMGIISPGTPLKDSSCDEASMTMASVGKGKLNYVNIETFKNNYDNLVSRVCKNESILQSLKLNFLHIQGDRDLNKKQELHMKEKVNYIREAYEQEISKLSRTVEHLQEELDSETTGREKAHVDIRELQKALSMASETRMEATMTAEGLTVSQQKLQRRIAELQEEVGRERSLRASLEDSHNTLLLRLRDLEAAVTEERTGVQSMAGECSSLRSEAERLRADVKEETHRKQIAETSYKMLCEDKDVIQVKFEHAESERQLLMSEFKRLREQYEDLVKQMEQTQSIIDKQQEIFLSDKLRMADQVTEIWTSNKEMVAQNEHLTEVINATGTEHDRITAQLRKDLQGERKRAQDKERVENDAATLQDSVTDLTRENHELKKKLKKQEGDVCKLKSRISCKDEEFTRTADSLEAELTSLREQLAHALTDRDRVLTDKETLLEEVNQTVDTIAAERTKLQKKVQQLQLDLDSHGRARRQLEHENAHLLERVASFEQQQVCFLQSNKIAQRHIENTLKEMMDQKNKLAYENGRLQTQTEQNAIELEQLRKADLDTAKYKQLSELLAAKYSQSETEISELKITIQRQDSQLKQAQTSLDTRHHDYSSVTDSRDDFLKENQKLLTQLQSVEEREKRKIRALQRNNEDAKAVNKEIASTLESVMSSHSQLQTVVEGLQVELGKKDSQNSKLKHDKNHEQQEWKAEIRRFEERMEKLREELRKERDKSTRKNTKDIAEIKKESEGLAARNTELMKSNTQLRQKTREQETARMELKDKVTDQKRKMEYLHKAKKELEENVHKMKAMKSDIEELENLRDTYMSKNQQQSEMISTFMGQINSLQTELRQLAVAQDEARHLTAQQGQATAREKQLTEDLHQKYLNSKSREDELDQLKTAAEKRLSEIRNESLEISGHLQGAHEWFKDKFENLQQELLSSRHTQENLERENTDQKSKLNNERKKAQAAAQKAKEMIRASRQTISRLSDYAELADKETKEQLSQLYSHLQQEKDHAKYVELKHKDYKDASARQFEHFLQETSS